jgi:WD40 repeat protein
MLKYPQNCSHSQEVQSAPPEESCSDLLACSCQVLEAHTDEVWYLQFSHDGRKLASASKDNTVIIWEVGASDHAISLRLFERPTENSGA